MKKQIKKEDPEKEHAEPEQRKGHASKADAGRNKKEGTGQKARGKAEGRK